MLIAKRVFNTRNEMVWGVYIDDDTASLGAHLEWTCAGSTGNSYAVSVTAKRIPIEDLDDIRVHCECPSARDLGNNNRNYCKHVRDCLVTVEDREKTAPPRYVVLLLLACFRVTHLQVP
jgi:hypothetical protein